MHILKKNRNISKEYYCNVIEEYYQNNKYDMF